jgi:hypothetical protein
VAVWKPHVAPACCIYCKKEFVAHGKQKWHKCDKSLQVRRQHYNDLRNTKARQTVRCKKKDLQRVGWKKCISCGAFTPNRFGRCNGCLERLGSLYDLDAIITFDSSFDRHNGVLMK